MPNLFQRKNYNIVPTSPSNLESAIQGHDRDGAVHRVVSTVTGSVEERKKGGGRGREKERSREERKDSFTMANHGAHDLIMLMQR